MKSESSTNNHQGILGLDRLSQSVKRFVWVICFILATYFAVTGYIHVGNSIAYSLPKYLAWLEWTPIIGSICIVVAVSRLLGVPWKQSLLFFIGVPLAMMVLYLIWILPYFFIPLP